jgi:hypothetical protein
MAECLREVRAAAPDFLWTAAATAEILDVRHAAWVLPVLYAALEQAGSGICPAWVLERYVKDMGQPRSLCYFDRYPIAP